MYTPSDAPSTSLASSRRHVPTRRRGAIESGLLGLAVPIICDCRVHNAADDATGVDSLWLSQTIRGDKGAQGASGVDAIYLCRARCRPSMISSDFEQRLPV